MARKEQAAVSLTREEIERIDAVAQREGRSRSAMLRRIVLEWLTKN